MSKKKKRLDGYDDVDIFGTSMGSPVGMGALYGAMIGAGAGTAAAIGVRAFAPSLYPYSELIGMGAGVAVGGAMMISPKTRHAGVVAIGTAVLNNGLRAAEAYFSGIMSAANAVAAQTAAQQPVNGAGAQLRSVSMKALSAPPVEMHTSKTTHAITPHQKAGTRPQMVRRPGGGSSYMNRR